MLKGLEYILMVQLFFAFGVSVLAYALDPMISSDQVILQYSTTASSMQNVTDKLSATTQNQLKISVVDLGALVFYSGNILVDLLLNFMTALPSIVTLIIGGFFMLFGGDAFIVAQLKAFIYIILTALYFLGLLSFILEIRSGVRTPI